MGGLDRGEGSGKRQDDREDDIPDLTIIPLVCIL